MSLWYRLHHWQKGRKGYTDWVTGPTERHAPSPPTAVRQSPILQALSGYGRPAWLGKARGTLWNHVFSPIHRPTVCVSG
jgi:hypothetical protein